MARSPAREIRRPQGTHPPSRRPPSQQELLRFRHSRRCPRNPRGGPTTIYTASRPSTGRKPGPSSSTAAAPPVFCSSTAGNSAEIPPDTMVLLLPVG